jgi:LppX_LprAFG lipoprotein
MSRGEMQQRNSKRATRLTLLFLSTSLLVPLVLVGCGGGKQERQLSVAQIVEQTTRKTGALKRFHFVFKVEHPAASRSGLSLSFAEGDVIIPDKLKADVAGTLSGVSLKSELVFVAPTQYLKDPLSGTWRKLETKTSPIGYFDPAKGVLAVIKGSTQLALAGSATVGGADSYDLKGKVHARDLTAILGNPPSERLVVVELLVGKSDLLLRRIRLEGPVSSGEPTNIARIVELSKFDEKVTIEVPKAG